MTTRSADRSAPTGRRPGRDLERAALRVGMLVRLFGASLGVLVMLTAAPTGGIPVPLAVGLIAVNTTAMTVTALRGLRPGGQLSGSLVLHHVGGDALNMTLIAVTLDPTATRSVWVLTLVAVGEAGALRGPRAAATTFTGVMLAIGATMAVVDGATAAVLARWGFVVFLAGGPSLVLAVQAGLMRGALARSERTRDQLHQAALHDELTGLLNRRGLRAAVEEAGTVGAALFVDLDHFKQVNDTLGHDAGDEVLRAVAGRLERGVREQDVVARLAGDEFAVVVDDDGPSPALLADRIEELLTAPIGVQDGIEVQVGASVGVAASVDGDPAALMELLDAADAAMYLRKATRRAQDASHGVRLAGTPRPALP